MRFIVLVNQMLHVPRRAKALGLHYEARHPVVATANRCPEYWLNLSDMGAQIVLADELANYPLEEALRHAAMGARYRVTPHDTTPLTPTERQVLHFLACGYSSQQIAQKLSRSDQSIRNMLTPLYRKLGVADRNAAQNYYWGVWPGITRATPATKEPAEKEL